MEQSVQWITQLNSGIKESQREQGGYYFLCTLGIWIAIQLRDNRFSEKTVGARWSIDGWNTYHDTLACFQQPIGSDELWRVEIDKLITTGWRDGSIGGPNGEQPSGNVWTLWGPSKQEVACLPLGRASPDFEFALFLRVGGHSYWENNLGQNFRIELSGYGSKERRKCDQ